MSLPFSRCVDASIRTSTLILLFVAIFTVSPAASQSRISDVEQEIVEYIEANVDGAIDLLARAVNINRGTMTFAGVRAVGHIFRAELDQLGFTTRWIDGAPFERAGHLIAERRGSGPGILLIGHLDTVFEEDSPFQRFERLSDSVVRGPGVIDMKGGNVIIVLALQSLQSVGLLEDLNIAVVLHGDEEQSGEPLSLARQTLVQLAQTADIAIGFEDGDGNPETAVIARRGFTGWQLNVRGRRAHSSLVFSDDIGFGAVYESARILNDFREQLVGERYLTFNPGIIVGGTTIEFDLEQSRASAFGKTNVIAESTTVAGDLRTISREQLESAKTRMRAIVSQNLSHTSAEIVFEDLYPPMAPTDGNQLLLTMVDQVSRDLGYGPVEAVDPGAAGAADISFVADHVEMAIDGLGLMGDGGHTLNETADLRTLPMQAKRAAILIHRLSRENN